MIKIFTLTAIILCYFLSSGITIYSQEISGYRWEEVTNIPEPYKNSYWLDVFFLKENPDFGWICGFDGKVLRTTDGGNIWRGTTIQTMKIDSLWNGNSFDYDTTYISEINQLESLSFSDENIGFVSGKGRIYKTTNGGESWDSLFNPNYEIWGNFFISKEIGVAVGGGCTESQHFYSTTNGGKTWSDFTTNEVQTGLSDVILFSADSMGYASSSGMIWRTNNWGITWNPLCSTGGKDWQEDISVSGNTILVPYSELCSGGGEKGGFRISRDLGKIWRDFNTFEPMFGTFLLDSLRGWGVGPNNSVYYTFNSGFDWHLLNEGIKENVPLDDVWFVNDTIGWLVGRGVYKFTGKIIVDVEDNINHGEIIKSLNPNPANDLLLIEYFSDSNDKFDFRIYNLTGILLLQKEINANDIGTNEIKFDLSSINSGFYIPQVKNGVKSEFIKIVKI